MRPEATPGQPRNWFAVAGLWTVGATWLGVIAVLFYAEFLDHEPSENIGWILLGIGTIGFVLTLTGFTVARSRGEWGLAWAALALVLAFATVLSPFLLYGFGGGE
jgi:hypothetical protein